MSEEIGERVAALEVKQDGLTSTVGHLTTTVAEHVTRCTKIQTYGLAIGCVTFGLVASESPKVGKIIQFLVEMFAQ